MRKLHLVLLPVLVGISTVFMGCPQEEFIYIPPKTYYLVVGYISTTDWTAFKDGTYDDYSYSELLTLFTDSRITIDGEPWPTAYMGGRTEAQVRSRLDTLLTGAQINTLITNAATYPTYMMFSALTGAGAGYGLFIYLEEELDGYGQRSVE